MGVDERLHAEIRIGKEVLARAVEAYRKIRATRCVTWSRISTTSIRRPTWSSARRSRKSIATASSLVKCRGRAEGAPCAQQLRIRRHLPGSESVHHGRLERLLRGRLEGPVYTFAAASRERRSAQTAMHIIADGPAQLLAPILSFQRRRSSGAICRRGSSTFGSHRAVSDQAGARVVRRPVTLLQQVGTYCPHCANACSLTRSCFARTSRSAFVAGVSSFGAPARFLRSSTPTRRSCRCSSSCPGRAQRVGVGHRIDNRPSRSNARAAWANAAGATFRSNGARVGGSKVTVATSACRADHGH